MSDVGHRMSLKSAKRVQLIDDPIQKEVIVQIVQVIGEATLEQEAFLQPASSFQSRRVVLDMALRALGKANRIELQEKGR